jgi:DNA-directed RNA polymerase specialized sigma24 family protein
VLDHVRSETTIKRGSGKPAAEVDDRVPSRQDLEAEVDHRLLLQRIDGCLSRHGATARDRGMFWLYFRDGMSAAAISQIPGISLSSKGVESAIIRLVKSVRECIKGRTAPIPFQERRRQP